MVAKISLLIYKLSDQNNCTNQVNDVYLFKYRGMEQLVARRAHNPKVVSSSLAPATTKSNHNWLLFFLALTQEYKRFKLVFVECLTVDISNFFI